MPHHTAGVVVVAPATIREALSVGHNRSGAHVSSSNCAELRDGEPGSSQQNRVRVQRTQGLNRRVERTATLTLASYALLLLLLPPPRLLVCSNFEPKRQYNYDCVLTYMFVRVGSE